MNPPDHRPRAHNNKHMQLPIPYTDTQVINEWIAAVNNVNK